MGRAARANRARRLAERNTVHLINPAQAHLAGYIRANARLGCPVVRENCAAGQTLAICGAGPSLADRVSEFCDSVDQVWACNGALPWFVQQGHRVTHGFTVEASDRMLDIWHGMFGVDYLCASSVDPALIAALVLRGGRVSLFHSLAGPTRGDVVEQDRLYASLYPPTICAGAGLNSVTRALDVATYMGFDAITVLGADCCLRIRPGAPPRSSVVPGTPSYDAWLREFATMHVNGAHPVEGGCSPLTLSGVIDGREWVAQADMWISSQWIVKMVRASQGRITVVGDGLPALLKDKPDSFLAQLPQTVNARTGEVIPIPF